MALFVNPGKDWEKNMSEEDIAQMESQGYDVTELRAKRAKSAEEEEKERLREKEERENFKNPTNLNKLAPYLQTPRDMSTSFFKAMAGSAPWLFKDRWKRKYTEAPIVYAAVVQANTALWMPGNNDYYPAVFVFALDQKHIHDTEWLKQIAEEINVLQDADQIPGDCRKLIQTLRDDTSEFCFRIGKSVCGDANAWCATYKFDKQTALPRKALPSDGIVPFLLKSAPVENQAEIGKPKVNNIFFIIYNYISHKEYACIHYPTTNKNYIVYHYQFAYRTKKFCPRNKTFLYGTGHSPQWSQSRTRA